MYKFFIYFAFSQCMLLPLNLFAQNKNKSSGEGDIIIPWVVSPALQKITSYSHCKNIDYSLRAEFIHTRVYKNVMVSEVKAKIFVSKNGKDKFLSAASKIVEKTFSAINSSGALCDNYLTGKMSLHIQGHSKLSEQQELLVIRFSNDGMIDHEIIKNIDGD